MIRTIGIWLAAAAAPYAWGQTGCGDDTEPGSVASQMQVCVVDRPRYARELFGAGADAVVLQFGEDAAVARDRDPAEVPRVGPRVLLEMPAPESGDAVAARSSATVTFRLQGAVFASRARDYDLSVDHLAEVNAGRLRVSKRAGGALGDDAVAFDIEVVGGEGLRGAGTAPVTLAFAVPSLTRTLDAMAGVSSSGVWIKVEVQSSGAAGGFPDFPAHGQTRRDGGVTDGEHDADAGLRLLVGKPDPTDWALVLKAGTGPEVGTIDTEVREVLVFSTPRDPQFLRVAGVSMALRGDLLQGDGLPFSVDAKGAGRRDDGTGTGVLRVTVAGEFRGGDVLAFDRDGDGRAGDHERFVIDASVAQSVAGLDFVLEDVVPGSYEVLYFPGGRDPLRSGSVTTTFAVAFERDTNLAPGPLREVADLRYLNEETALLAYAIAPPSAPDTSYLRIRCESAAPCDVYMACDGADGAHYFGKLDGPVAPWTVDTVTALRLGETIGASDEDFAGGMSCEVIAEDVSVQILIRSGGTLANYTYVGGRFESLLRGTTRAAPAR